MVFNTKGELVIQPKFTEAYSFSHGLAQVKLGKRIGYIDRTGTYAWKPTE